MPVTRAGSSGSRSSGGSRAKPRFTVPQRYVFSWVAGQQSETIWVFGTIDQIAVHFGDVNVQRQPESVEAHLTLLTAAERHAPSSFVVLPATARPQW